MVFFNDVLINLMMVAAIKKAETKDPTLEKKYGIILITGAGQVLTEFLYASSEERDASFYELIDMIKKTSIYETVTINENNER